MTTSFRVFSISCGLLVLFYAMFTAISLHAAALPPIMARGDDNYPPYEFLEKGRPTGFNVDIMKAAAAVMGREVDIQLVPWHHARHDLETGAADALTGMYYSPERARAVDFSMPHIIVTHSIFVRKGSRIRTLDDLRGKELIVQEGDIMHDYAARHRLTEHIVTAENPLKALQLLSSGKHDAALLSRLQGLYLAGKYGLNKVEAAGPSILPQEYCFAVRKGDRVLLAQLNEGLRLLRSTGRYREIHDRWFGAYEPMVSKEKFLRYIVLIAAPVLLILLISLAWSYLLKRRVNQATMELRKQLSERERMEGELVEANAYLEETLRNLKNTEDELRTQFGKLQDRELLLGESERRFRALLENVQLLAVIIDAGGAIAFFNEYALELTGWRQEEVIGKNYFDMFITDDFRPRLRALFEQVLDAGRITTHGTNHIIRRDGSRRLIRWSNTVLLGHDGRVEGVASIGEDITDRDEAEQRLKASLAEKEVLLKEIHHRVKNNLQVVSSLLNLQASKADPAAAGVFKEVRDRVQSMALIHEQLYRSSDLASINFASYIHDLALHLYRSHSISPDRVEMVIDVENVLIDITRGVPCGLIVSELISNAFKHAFRAERKGRVEVHFRRDNGYYRLLVRDDGSGFPAGTDFREIPGMGMRLVNALVDQIGGNIALESGNGSAFMISFPVSGRK